MRTGEVTLYVVVDILTDINSRCADIILLDGSVLFMFHTVSPLLNLLNFSRKQRPNLPLISVTATFSFVIVIVY